MTAQPTVYNQFDKAFSNAAAYVVLKDGECVAKIAIKFPVSGEGRLYAYVHWLGVQMVRGSASGYGYDKRSAAVADTIAKFKRNAIGKTTEHEAEPFQAAEMTGCVPALEKDGGEYLGIRRLRNAGFTVIQAI